METLLIYTSLEYTQFLFISLQAEYIKKRIIFVKIFLSLHTYNLLKKEGVSRIQVCILSQQRHCLYFLIKFLQIYIFSKDCN